MSWKMLWKQLSGIAGNSSGIDLAIWLSGERRKENCKCWGKVMRVRVHNCNFLLLVHLESRVKSQRAELNERDSRSKSKSCYGRIIHNVALKKTPLSVEINTRHTHRQFINKWNIKNGKMLNIEMPFTNCWRRRDVEAHERWSERDVNKRKTTQKNIY